MKSFIEGGGGSLGAGAAAGSGGLNAAGVTGTGGL
jgi:hypothetical protein